MESEPVSNTDVPQGSKPFSKTDGADFPPDLSYQSGFGNHFASEAIPGALPPGQNSPLICPYGLYAEQISGTSFTSPRKLNLRRSIIPTFPCAFEVFFKYWSVDYLFDSYIFFFLSFVFVRLVSWLYRIKPSVTHEPFKPRSPGHGKLVSEFDQSNSSTTPTQLRWRPADVPNSPTDFIDGLYTVCGAGSSFLRHGFAIHM